MICFRLCGQSKILHALLDLPSPAKKIFAHMMFVMDFTFCPLQIRFQDVFATRQKTRNVATANQKGFRAFHSVHNKSTGAGPCIRDYPIETNLLFSWNFGRYSAGTRHGNLRFLANSFSSMLIQVDLSTVLESS